MSRTSSRRSLSWAASQRTARPIVCTHFKSLNDPHEVCRACRDCSPTSSPCKICLTISPCQLAALRKSREKSKRRMGQMRKRTAMLRSLPVVEPQPAADSDESGTSARRSPAPSQRSPVVRTPRRQHRQTSPSPLPPSMQEMVQQAISASLPTIVAAVRSSLGIAELQEQHESSVDRWAAQRLSDCGTKRKRQSPDNATSKRQELPPKEKGQAGNPSQPGSLTEEGKKLSSSDRRLRPEEGSPPRLPSPFVQHGMSRDSAVERAGAFRQEKTRESGDSVCPIPVTHGNENLKPEESFGTVKTEASSSPNRFHSSSQPLPPTNESAVEDGMVQQDETTGIGDTTHPGPHAHHNDMGERVETSEQEDATPSPSSLHPCDKLAEEELVQLRNKTGNRNTSPYPLFSHRNEGQKSETNSDPVQAEATPFSSLNRPLHFTLRPEPFSHGWKWLEPVKELGLTMDAIVPLVYEALPENVCQRPPAEIVPAQDPLVLDQPCTNRSQSQLDPVQLPQSNQLFKELVRYSVALWQTNGTLEPEKKSAKVFFGIRGHNTPSFEHLQPFPEAERLPGECPIDIDSKIRPPRAISISLGQYEMEERVTRAALRANSHADLMYSAAYANMEKMGTTTDPQHAAQCRDKALLLMRKAYILHGEAIHLATQTLVNSMLHRRDAYLASSLLPPSQRLALRCLPIHNAQTLFNGQLKVLAPSTLLPPPCQLPEARPQQQQNPPPPACTNVSRAPDVTAAANVSTSNSETSTAIAATHSTTRITRTSNAATAMESVTSITKACTTTAPIHSTTSSTGALAATAAIRSTRASTVATPIPIITGASTATTATRNLVSILLQHQHPIQSLTRDQVPVQGISTKPVSFGEHGHCSSATSPHSVAGGWCPNVSTILLSHKTQDRILPCAPKKDGAAVNKHLCNDTEPTIAQLHAAVKKGSCSGSELKIVQLHGAVKKVPFIDNQPKIAQLHAAVKLCTCSDSELTISHLRNRKTTPHSSGGGDQHDYCAPSGRVTDWSVASVGQWLLALGMKKFCNSFAKSKINGLKLLQLDSDRLRALGMTSGSDRSLFRRKLKHLKNRKYSSETKKFEERLKKKAKKTGKKK